MGLSAPQRAFGFGSFYVFLHHDGGPVLCRVVCLPRNKRHHVGGHAEETRHCLAGCCASMMFLNPIPWRVPLCCCSQITIAQSCIYSSRLLSSFAGVFRLL